MRGAREGSWLAYTDTIPLSTLDLHPVISREHRLSDSPADFVSIPQEVEWCGSGDGLLDYYETAKARIAVVAPGTVWETKQWRADAFADVARSLLQQKLSVVLIGSEGERGLCEEIARLAPGVVNLAGETSLSELAALISRAAICVTNDSGPMHLAVALGRPVVSVFGPTDPVWAGPYRQPDSVIRAGVQCSPCYLRRLRECPNSHACMQQVPADTVIARAEKMIGPELANPRPSRR